MKGCRLRCRLPSQIFLEPLIDSAHILPKISKTSLKSEAPLA